jgi:hypothetical protein
MKRNKNCMKPIYKFVIIIYQINYFPIYIDYGILINYIYFLLGLLKPFLVMGSYYSCLSISYEKSSIIC